MAWTDFLTQAGEGATNLGGGIWDFLQKAAPRIQTGLETFTEMRNPQWAQLQQNKRLMGIREKELVLEMMRRDPERLSQMLQQITKTYGQPTRTRFGSEGPTYEWESPVETPKQKADREVAEATAAFMQKYLGGAPAGRAEGAPGITTIPSVPSAGPSLQEGAAEVPGYEVGFNIGGISLKPKPAPEKMAPATLAKLEEDIRDTGKSLMGLSQVASSFDPAFLTYVGKAGPWIKRQEEKLPIPSGTITGIGQMFGLPTSAEFLSAKSVWQQSAMQAFLQWRKTITGVAFGAIEAEDIAKSHPDPKTDSPTEFISKLNAIQQFTSEYLQILTNLRQKGQLPQNAEEAGAIIRQIAPKYGLLQLPATSIPKVKTIEEARKLTPGTRFVDPNGVERIR